MFLSMCVRLTSKHVQFNAHRVYSPAIPLPATALSSAATVASGVIEFQAECARREVNTRTFSPSRGKRCYRAIKRRACSATKALIMPKIRPGLTRKTITRSAFVKGLDKRFLSSLLASCVNPIHAYTNTYIYTHARAYHSPLLFRETILLTLAHD